MNSKKNTIILIIIFVGLMIGTSALYNSLSEKYKPDALSLNQATTENSVPNNTDSASKESNKNATSQETASEDNNNENTSSKSSSEDSNNGNETSENDSAAESELTLAPDFTVYDLEGNEVHLTDFFGKPIIVNFWASWCGPCKMEMPDFDVAYNTYKDDIVFLMVNMTDGSRETIEVASEFIANSGYTFPVYYDTQYSAAITYSVASLPTSYFLNEKGELVAHAKGAIDAETLQRGIDMIYNP